MGDMIRNYGLVAGGVPRLDGELTSVTDPLGHATSYVYDDFGEQTKTVAPDPGRTKREDKTGQV